MQGFTTTDGGGWTFEFGGKPEVPDLPEGSDRISYLDDPEVWANYSDDALYEVESLFLKWAKAMLDDRRFVQGNPKYRKYTCGMLFERLYGHKYDMRDPDDAVRMRRMPRVLGHYSSRIQKEGTVLGKKMTKTIYTLSVKRIRNQRPFSLRLREEWLAGQGKVPTWKSMRPVKKELGVGQARNPKTQANMERRRQRAKEAYNERYSGRKH